MDFAQILARVIVPAMLSFVQLDAMDNTRKLLSCEKSFNLHIKLIMHLKLLRLKIPKQTH